MYDPDHRCGWVEATIARIDEIERRTPYVSNPLSADMRRRRNALARWLVRAAEVEGILEPSVHDDIRSGDLQITFTNIHKKRHVEFCVSHRTCMALRHFNDGETERRYRATDALNNFVRGEIEWIYPHVNCTSQRAMEATLVCGSH